MNLKKLITFIVTSSFIVSLIPVTTVHAKEMDDEVTVEAEVETKTEVKTESKSLTESKSETESNTDSMSNTDVDADADDNIANLTETKTNSKSKTDIDTEIEVETDTDIDTDIQVDATAKTENKSKNMIEIPEDTELEQIPIEDFENETEVAIDEYIYWDVEMENKTLSGYTKMEYGCLLRADSNTSTKEMLSNLSEETIHDRILSIIDELELPEKCPSEIYISYRVQKDGSIADVTCDYSIEDKSSAAESHDTSKESTANDNSNNTEEIN